MRGGELGTVRVAIRAVRFALAVFFMVLAVSLAREGIILTFFFTESGGLRDLPARGFDYTAVRRHVRYGGPARDLLRLISSGMAGPRRAGPVRTRPLGPDADGEGRAPVETMGFRGTRADPGICGGADCALAERGDIGHVIESCPANPSNGAGFGLDIVAGLPPAHLRTPQMSHFAQVCTPHRPPFGSRSPERPPGAGCGLGHPVGVLWSGFRSGLLRCHGQPVAGCAKTLCEIVPPVTVLARDLELGGEGGDLCA